MHGCCMAQEKAVVADLQAALAAELQDDPRLREAAGLRGV